MALLRERPIQLLTSVDDPQQVYWIITFERVTLMNVYIASV